MTSLAVTTVSHRILPALRRRPAVTRVAVAGVLVALIGGGHPFEQLALQQSRGETVRSMTLAADPAFDSEGSAHVRLSLPRNYSLGRPRSQPAALPGDRHALLVGINNAAGGRPLQGAVTDAVNVKHALLNYGFPAKNITTLLDGQATRAAILQGLDALARDTPPSGVAVFAVAAHSRRFGGTNQLLTAEGARINASEIASRLQRVRSRMWVALPTCYAEGYALPGIVGRNRVATFASSGNTESYELGRAGSYMILEMVQRAMIEKRAPYSVESAFDWAQADLKRSHPYRVPMMSDGVDGDLVLGGVTWDAGAAPDPRHSYAQNQAQPANGPSPSPDPQPQPTPDPGGHHGSRETALEVCGSYRWNCQHP